MRLKRFSIGIHRILTVGCGKGGWYSDEIETVSLPGLPSAALVCGKGGWDSDEIETEHQALARRSS